MDAHTLAIAASVPARACKWRQGRGPLCHMCPAASGSWLEGAGLCASQPSCSYQAQEKVPASSAGPIKADFSSREHPAEGLPTLKRPLKLT